MQSLVLIVDLMDIMLVSMIMILGDYFITVGLKLCYHMITCFYPAYAGDRINFMDYL